MKRYIILESNFVDEMEDEVEKYLQKGYVPFGGLVCHSQDTERFLFLQAMITKDLKDKCVP